MSAREFDILNALKIAKKESNDFVILCESYLKGSRVTGNIINYNQRTITLIVKGLAEANALSRLFVDGNLNVYSQLSNFTFKSKVLSFYKTKLTITFPQEFEFLYSRSHPRINVERELNVSWKPSDAGLEKERHVDLPVYDISKGGISVLVNTLQMHEFEQSETLNELCFEQDELTLFSEVVGIHRNQSENLGYSPKKHRIALKFCEMPDKSKENVEKLLKRFDNEIARVS